MIAMEMWDISNHYLSHEIFNLDILLEQKIQNLVITPKIYYDTGFKSNLMHVDELYYISLLINYSFNNNISFVSKIDPLLRKEEMLLKDLVKIILIESTTVEQVFHGWSK